MPHDRGAVFGVNKLGVCQSQLQYFEVACFASYSIISTMLLHHFVRSQRFQDDYKDQS